MVDDGGPAFAAYGTGDWQVGMSIREWLTGQALNGAAAAVSPSDDGEIRLAVDMAVRLADEAIARLKRE